MTSVLFDGVDDLATYNPGAPLTEADAKTLLIVAKSVSGTSWASLLEGEDNTGVIRAAIGRRSNGRLYFADGAGIQDGGATLAITATTTWWLLAVTDVAGASSPRFHKVNIGGGSPVHVAGTAAASSALQVSRWKLCGDDDPANFKVAAYAIFNIALTDAQIEAIAAAATTQSIADLGPIDLKDAADGLLSNLVNPGTYDRSALVGTTTSADDPPGWVYGLGGGGEAHSGASDVSGGGRTTATGRKGGKAATASTGGGTTATAGTKASTGLAAATGGGNAASHTVKGGQGASTASGAGLTATLGAKNGLGASTATGGGTIVTATTSGRFGVSTVTGGGNTTSTGTTHESRTGISRVSGGGTTATAGQKAASGASRASGDGSIRTVATTARFAAVTTSGGGHTTSAAATARFAASLVSGGGTATTAGFRVRPVFDPIRTGRIGGGTTGRVDDGHLGRIGHTTGTVS